MLNESTSHSGRAGQPQSSCNPDVVFGDGRLPLRFWVKVEPQKNGCWLWTAARSQKGYGYFTFDIRRGARQAYRGAYVALIGPVPSGLHLDHLCSNRACVNPAHLEPVTASENNRRTAERRTHCKRGHAVTPANTKLVKIRGGKTGRLCRACWLVAHSRASRRSYAKQKLRTARAA